MMIGQMVQMVQDLSDDETCPICGDESFIECPRHGAELDEDGWCAICETPMDGGPANPVSCPCQADSEEELRAMVARIWGV